MDSPLRLVRRLRAEPRRRYAVEAAAIAALGLALIALGLVDIAGIPWTVPTWATDPWWHAVPLVLGCMALLAKRRRPVTTTLLVVPLVAADVAIGASIGMYLVLADALYCLVLHTRRSWVRPAITTIAAAIVLATVAGFVATGDLQQAAASFLSFFALLGTPVWWGMTLRQQAELAELAQARADDLQRLSELQQHQAVRDERTRMAQDLHDALSSHLSTIAIHSAATMARADQEGVDAARSRAAATSLTEIRAASVRALEDLREMILLLQTGQDQITPAAHLADLSRLVETARSAGLRLEVDGDAATLPPLPSVTDQAAYRIVQEALVNATKHAPGAHVEVDVQAGDQTLRLTVTCRPDRPGAGPGQDGHAPVQPTGSGLGLRTMRDRARTLGGTFQAGWREDVAGRVWVVEAELPLAEVLVR